MHTRVKGSPREGARNEAVAYLNGEWRPKSDVAVSIDDRGFVFGDTLYDVVSALDGVIFRLDDHLERFFASMRAVRIESPISREEWRDRMIDCVRRNGLRDASIRIMITRGVPERSATPRDYVDLRTFVPSHRPTTIITASPYYYLADAATREHGARLWVSSVRTMPADTVDPRVKHHSRLHFQLARLEALEAGCDDAVLLDHRGFLAEGPASNVFVVRGDTVCTPQTGVLGGITRMTLREVADRVGIGWRETDLSPAELLSAEEVFTASTGGGILPVSSVSGRAPKRPVPGPITERLDKGYWAMRREGMHGTPVYPGEQTQAEARAAASCGPSAHARSAAGA